jgi:hypothetical protein
MACGLCCDGTLFDQTNLSADDDIGPLAGMGIDAVFNQTEPALRQPCAAYKNCVCSIYPDRPHVCRQFRCRLLRRFNANKISEGDALDIIRKAIALRDNVKQQMRTVFGKDNCSFDNFTAHLSSYWNDASSADANASVAALFQSFAALWLCINKHFRWQWRR